MNEKYEWGINLNHSNAKAFIPFPKKARYRKTIKLEYDQRFQGAVTSDLMPLNSLDRKGKIR